MIYEAIIGLLIIILLLLSIILVMNKKMRGRITELEAKENEQNLEIARLHDLLEKSRNDLDNYKNISKHEMQNELSKLKKEYDKLKKSILAVLEKNKELKKNLEFFTEIGEDSKLLNDTVDSEDDVLIEKAVRELEGKPNSDTQSEIVKSIAKPIVEDKHTVLDHDQKRAIKAMEEANNNYFITGKAGTSKSLLLRTFEKSTNKKTLKLAPTGIAALNIGGATLHSIFGYNNLEKLDTNNINKNTIRLKSEKRLILREVDTLLIDEISMIRADTLDKINRILKIINGNEKPFGGKQVLAFGDLFQLPPIANRSEQEYLKEKYGGVFFFLSEVYKEARMEFIELSVNHRQNQDQTYFEILNRIREGTVTDRDMELINQRVVKDREELRRIVRLFPKKEEAERVNKLELSRINAREYTYEAEIVFNKTQDQNITIAKLFPIASILTIKKGALIMMVNNDYLGRWVNGTLGIVSNLSKDMIKVKINDIEYEVHKEKFTAQEAIYKNNRIEYEDIIEISQYPMILAYAITIHKSQGMTYKRIACDLSDCFVPGQAYVALSRCSHLDGLHLLKKVSKAKVTVDSEIKNYYLNTRRLF